MALGKDWGVFTKVTRGYILISGSVPGYQTFVDLSIPTLRRLKKDPNASRGGVQGSLFR